MASKSAQDIIMTEVLGDRHELGSNKSSMTFTDEGTGKTENSEALESSSYTLASDQSQFSSALDSWLKETKVTANTGVQGSRVPVVQRSTLMTPSFGFPAMSYILATLLPIFSITANYPYMRCLPGTIIKTAEFVFTQLANIMEGVQRHLRRLGRDRHAREFIAAAMDVILIAYALGFLIISMYQASVFA